MSLRNPLFDLPPETQDEIFKYLQLKDFPALLQSSSKVATNKIIRTSLFKNLNQQDLKALVKNPAPLSQQNIIELLSSKAFRSAPDDLVLEILAHPSIRKWLSREDPQLEKVIRKFAENEVSKPLSDLYNDIDPDEIEQEYVQQRLDALVNVSALAEETGKKKVYKTTFVSPPIALTNFMKQILPFMITISIEEGNTLAFLGNLYLELKLLLVTPYPNIVINLIDLLRNLNLDKKFPKLHAALNDIPPINVRETEALKKALLKLEQAVREEIATSARKRVSSILANMV